MSFFLLVSFSSIIFATNCLGAVIGAGSTVIAIPLCIMLLGIETAKPVLTMYGLLLNIYLCAVSWRDIDFPALRRILVIMGLGLPLGIAAYDFLPKTLLQQVLSVFILIVAVRGLILARWPDFNMGNPGELLLNAILFSSGVIQGAFATGGPLLISYAAEKLKAKNPFRATQAIVWVFTNGIMTAQMGYAGHLADEVWKVAAYGMPVLIAGGILGNRLHYRMDQKVFTVLTYCLLCATGIIMAYDSFRN